MEDSSFHLGCNSIVEICLLEKTGYFPSCLITKNKLLSYKMIQEEKKRHSESDLQNK